MVHGYACMAGISFYCFILQVLVKKHFNSASCLVWVVGFLLTFFLSCVKKLQRFLIALLVLNKYHYLDKLHTYKHNISHHQLNMFSESILHQQSGQSHQFFRVNIPGTHSQMHMRVYAETSAVKQGRPWGNTLPHRPQRLVSRQRQCCSAQL